MPISEPQARAVAYLLNQIRPDWPVPSLLTLLERNRDVPSLGTLIIAATTKALDPTCATPAPIFTQGTHWPAQHRDQLPRSPQCRTHHDYEPCRGCAADRKAEHHDPYANAPADPRWVKETT